MEKLSNIGAELKKKRCLLKKGCKNSQETISDGVNVFAKIDKIYIQRTFSSEISQIFQSSFSSTFRQLLL